LFSSFYLSPYSTVKVTVFDLDQLFDFPVKFEENRSINPTPMNRDFRSVTTPLRRDLTEIGDIRAEIASGRHVLHERPQYTIMPIVKINVNIAPTLQLASRFNRLTGCLLQTDAAEKTIDY